MSDTYLRLWAKRFKPLERQPKGRFHFEFSVSHLR